MAENSKIEWTDATVNFWWGCTKVGPGCDHCYAEAWDKRTGGAHFGQGVPRRKIKSAVKTLHRLDNEYSWWAADLVMRDGEKFRPRNVFVQSMSDLFDNEVPLEWFAEGWQAISACNRLNVQIVTKRLPMVEKRIAAVGGTWPAHAGLIVTVVNQAEADRDVPRLLNLKAKLGIPWVGLSVEPMLGPVDLERVYMDRIDHAFGTSADLHGIDWVICGGESGPGARPMHPDWARSLRDQCVAAGVAFHFKQHGEFVQASHDVCPDSDMSRNKAVWLGWDGKQAKPYHTGLDRPVGVIRVGKKAAGRLLDGRTWDEMPEVSHG